MNRILIAEDDATSRRILETILGKWGYDVTATANGEEAWDILRYEGSPRLAILDRMMPDMDGLEVCRRVRDMNRTDKPHTILLTAMGRKEDVIEGLEAGADDYVIKPFSNEELRVRIRVAKRIIELESALSDRVQELELALKHVRTLQDILPICMFCHKIRNDQESWQQMEQYVLEHTDTEFSHGVCPECMKEHYPDVAQTSKKVDSA